MSEIVGKTFPCSFVGSYPRPSWFDWNLGGRDLLEAFRDEDFAQAYRDAIRAAVGDQEEAGLDVLTDGHLWYDKHQGFIASFLLYNVERIEGMELRTVATFANPALSRGETTDETVLPSRLGRATEVFDIHLMGS
jgi:5-methyltetrahydropteroyltriglutamate--homocysteine methyltransferase